MEFSEMRGDLLAAAGSEDRLEELAWDLYSVLRKMQTRNDRDQLVTRILDHWGLEMPWMNCWQKRFDAAMQAGQDDAVAEWLAAGAPEVPEQHQELSEATPVAC